LFKRRSLDVIRHPTLAAAGEAGIVRMLGTVGDEMPPCSTLPGTNSFAEFDEFYLHAATRANLPHVFSTCPLREIPTRY
jgi:hypothetical protein